MQPLFRRILLKLSGEALMGAADFGIDPNMLHRLAEEIQTLAQMGVQIALVLGGGNLFRGQQLAASGMHRVTGDQMGMLATIMNALAMRDSLERRGLEARVLSALSLPLCETYQHHRALAHLEKGRILLLAAGTGNPFFTTDSAASLRAVELEADLLIKATKVDGVYSEDPLKNPQAVFYERLTYAQALGEELGVMDTTAIVLCREHQLPIRVLNIYRSGALKRLMQGEPVGSLIAGEEDD